MRKNRELLDLVTSGAWTGRKCRLGMIGTNVSRRIYVDGEGVSTTANLRTRAAAHSWTGGGNNEVELCRRKGIITDVELWTCRGYANDGGRGRWTFAKGGLGAFNHGVQDQVVSLNTVSFTKLRTHALKN